MSIDNGHYKQFGGIDDHHIIKDFRTNNIYTNTVSARTYQVNDLVWDVCSNENKITNVLDGNIIIGGEISGNFAPGAGENVVFKSDKQYWNAFTDVNNIGRIINKNTSATDISGITLSEPATAYLYDGMVEISGVLISGHLHVNSDNSHNLVFIQGISNEIQGTEPSRYHHVEGENNVVVAGNTQYSHVEGYGNKISGHFIQCEGSGNVIYGDFSHAEGEKNRIDISGTGNFCFVEGYDCSVSGVSEFSKAEGYKSSVVNSNYSLAYGREGTVKNSYGSIVGGIEADIDGGGSNDTGGFLLITELNQGDPINNPWTGTGEAGSPDVLIPLNTLSSQNGEDLEIKMEWDNSNGTTSRRFYKGWRLNEVFDYTATSEFSTSVICYAKFSEHGTWYSYNQITGTGHNFGWNWSFSAKNGLGHQIVSKSTFESSGMSGVIHHYNAGLLIHGATHASNEPSSDLAAQIWAGEDENSSSSYIGITTWSKLRVYAKVNAYNYVEGSGNQINNATGAFVAGMGNRSQSSYSTVLGEYNEASNNVIFSIGHGTGDADNQRKDALVIRTDNTQTGAGRGEGIRDISINVGMSATDISVGWWIADPVHQNSTFTVSISDEAIWIDGSKNGTVELDRYKTYTFMQDGSSNVSEPFIIVATQDNSSTVLARHQGLEVRGTAGIDRQVVLNVNDLEITNSTLYYMSNNNTINGGTIKIKDNIYENGLINVTNNSNTSSTKIFSNGQQLDNEINSIIYTTDISCTGDVSAIPHYTNGVLDYNSGFLFGSSEGLTNADKWNTGNKIQHLGSSKSQIYAATFDGSNYMDISNSLIQDLDSPEFSFTVWLKLTNTDLYSRILGSFGDTSGGFLFYHRGTNNNLGFQVSNANYTYSVSQTVSLHTWYHVACTYEPVSGNIALYLNGVNNSLVYQAGTGYTPALNKYRFSIGTSSEASTWSPIWQRLKGKLYDFRYFNRVITQSEITDLYNNPAEIGNEVLRLPLSNTVNILTDISGSYTSFTVSDISNINVSATEIIFTDSADDLDLYNRLVLAGVTEYDISYVYNIDASLVDISGAGFQMRAKKTMLIETNLHELVVSDTSVCDVISVVPTDTGGGTDVYLSIPYYGIGTKYCVQFPPAGSLVSPDTSCNYNRVIFDMNGGGFSTSDAIVKQNIGFAIHFVYTSETDGLIWKSRLQAYDAT